MNIPADISKVYLIGLMGAGKSTVGKILAAEFDWQFVDLDHEIEALAGKDIPTIFEEETEEGFRLYEKQILQNTASFNETIIACGGGVVTKAENIAFLQGEITIWLDLSPAEAAARLEHAQDRPLLSECQNTLSQLNDILISRREAYAKTAKIRIKSGELSPELIASNILKEIKQFYA